MTERSFDAPNYTQTPNVVFDVLLRDITRMAELKVTLAIIRATFGWHKDEDKLSFSQLEERTAMTRQGVNEGVKAALERGFVQRRKEGKSYVYWLRVSDPDSQGSGPADSQPSKPMTPEGLVSDSDPQKKSTTSKEIGKEMPRPEVETLCQLMADLSNKRTDPEGNRKTPKYKVTQGGFDAMRRLIDIDGRSPELIERAIRWVDQHDFWRKNILAPDKLRKQFDTIYLEAQQQKPAGRTSKADSIDSKVETLRRGAES